MVGAMTEFPEAWVRKGRLQHAMKVRRFFVQEATTIRGTIVNGLIRERTMAWKSLMTTMLASVLLSACGGGSGGMGGGAPTSVSLDKSRLDLTYEAPFGSGYTGEVTVTFKGAGVGVAMPPGQTQPSWLFVAQPTLVDASTARVRFDFLPSSSLNGPQRVSTTLRIGTADANGNNVVFRDFTVTGTLDHELSATRQVLTYTRDSATAPAAGIDVRTRNATWEATSNAAWLQVTPASGTGDATLTITGATTLAEGDYSGTITVRDTVTNRSKTATILLGVDPRRLELDKQGLALSSTLGRSRLTATARVIDTANLAGRWTISDDAPWLSTSATSGAGASNITLTANPTGLADGTYYATVTASPDAEPGLTNTATLRVGFFVDHTNAAQSSVRILGNTPVTSATVADPIRPLIYAFDIEFPNSTLRVWNVYTGALMDSQTLPNAVIFGAQVTPDGAQLLAIDSSATGGIIPIALSAGAPVAAARWTGMRADMPVSEIAIARLNGVPVIAWPPNQLLSATDGRVLANILLSNSATFPASPALSTDGRRLFVVNKYVGNHFLAYVALGYRAGTFSASVMDEFIESNDGTFAMFDRDDTHVISLASGALRRYTFGSRTSGPTVFANGFRPILHPDGSFYMQSTTGPNWLHYDSSLNVIATSAPGVADGKTLVAISADGQRMVTFDSNLPLFGNFADLDF